MPSHAAYAKVNLTLEVLGNRDDGYHEIASVVQTVSLADTISFRPAGKLTFVCRDRRVALVRPLEEVVLRAANLLRKEAGCRDGAYIELETAAIPRAAGLGSSAALPAVTLRGLNELWSLGFSMNTLSQLAAMIGSDVPFLLLGGTALVEGRGERVTPLPPLPTTWLVLLRPALAPVPHKTASLYGLLNQSHFTSGAITRELVAAIEQGRASPPALMYNAFEAVAFDFFPRLRECRDSFLAAGASDVHLCGAGPTLFAPVPSKANGELLASRLRRNGQEAITVHTVQTSLTRGLSEKRGASR